MATPPKGQRGLVGVFNAANAQRDAVETFSGRHLAADLQLLGEQRAGLRPTVARNVGQIGNAESRLRRALGAQASQTTARSTGATPVSFRGALEQATRRMGVRRGIEERGDAAIRNQTLRDRIQVARGSASRRGALQNMLQTTQNIREGVNVGLANANQRIAESNANLFGSLAGAATSAFINRDRSSGFGGLGEGVTEQSVNMGTAAADIANMGGPVGVYS